MKQLSIKGRITLWYALLLLVICTLAVWTLMTAGQRAAERYCRDTLENAAVIIQDELEIEHGLLEIDHDIDEIPDVYAALFHDDGSLIYGRARVDAPFAPQEMRNVREDGRSWYIYDVHLSVPQWESVWLRLHMSSDELAGMHQAVRRLSLWLLPLLALLALAGGYAITARAFRPVRHMSEVAASIAQGEDLSRRIDVSASDDELGSLGHTLNGMLQRLEHAFRREQQFTSDAAHELRTPLNAITTQAEYALSQPELSAKDESLEQILHTVHGMSSLVRQLLALSRLESGQMERSDQFDLAQMLCEAAEEMQPVAMERGASITVCAQPCAMEANHSMLMRAVINLLDNAIRYGKENGRIEICLHQTADEVQITVGDDGPGLAEHELAQVFTRFWRADASRSSRGTGIGLALVQSVAKAHGGSAQAQSAPGEGCAFTLRIPLK